MLAGFAPERASDHRRYGRSVHVEGLVLSAMIHQRFRGFKCLQDAVIVWGKRQWRGQCGWSPAEDAKIHISPSTWLEQRRLLDFYSQRKPMALRLYFFLSSPPHPPLEQEKGHRAQICAIFLAKPKQNHMSLLEAVRNKLMKKFFKCDSVFV